MSASVETDTASPWLSVVLPGLTESHARPLAGRTARARVRQAGIEDHEIILVNDGSTDDTGEIAERLAREDPRIRVLHHERNQGQPACILHGFRQARGRILTWNGMDLPFHPRDTAGALRAFDAGADVVVVERSSRSAYGIARKVISWSNVLLVRLLFRSPFSDHNFVQFYRREVVESVPVLSTGVSTVTAELILRAKRMGYRVVAMKAEYHQRTKGKSTITSGNVADALLETSRLWWLMQTRRRPAHTPGRRTQQRI